MVVNGGSVHYRICVMEIGVCGCKCRECVAVNVESVNYRICVLEIGVCGCKCRKCQL